MLSNFACFSLPFLLLPPSPSFVLCLQSLVYSSSTGERDVFAHSLTRRDWQNAGRHNEQICSCKRTHIEGNCVLFVGVSRARESLSSVMRNLSTQQSNCYGSQKKKTKILMYSYVFRKSRALCPVKAVEFKTVQLLQFSSITNCCMIQLLYFSVTN